MKHAAFWGAAVVLLVSSHVFAAITVVHDRFDSSGATRGDDANDPLDVAWLKKTGSSMDVDAPAPGGVVSDTIINTGSGNNALELKQTYPNASGQYANVIAAPLAVPVTLNQIGERVTLRMNFLIPATGSPQNQTNLKLGLYNSNGTTAFGDESAALDNDRGYLVSIPTGASKLDVQFESGAASGLLFGSDVSVLGTDGLTTAANTRYTAFLTVERTFTGVQVYGSVQDSFFLLADAEASHNAGFLTSFDELVIGSTGPQANNVLYDYTFHVDTVDLTVPEPTSLTVILVAAFPLLTRRRTRHSPNWR
jgi:hypothetical protein